MRKELAIFDIYTEEEALKYALDNINYGSIVEQIEEDKNVSSLEVSVIDKEVTYELSSKEIANDKNSTPYKFYDVYLLFKCDNYAMTLVHKMMSKLHELVREEIFRLLDKYTSEHEKAEPIEGDVIEATPDPLNGMTGMLSGMFGADMAKNVEQAINNFKTKEQEEKEYYDNHVHYNVLVEAVEEFDNKVIKGIGAVAKLDGSNFDAEIQTIVAAFSGFFTIGNVTNYLEMDELIEELRRDLEYEYKTYCGYKNDKGRDVTAAMRIAQTNLYNKVLHVIDKIEFELKAKRGVLPPPRDDK